jgi:hypothetical protein
MSIRNLHLITETTYDFEILEESSDGGKEKDLYVVGIFSSAEAKNANGRIYHKSTLDREIKRLYEENFKPGLPLYGLLGHPDGAETDLSKVAVRTVALEWRGNDVYGKAKIIRGTPCGDIAAALLKDSKLGISSRGLGQVDEDGYVSDESYKLLTWDLVSQPSAPGAWVNGIYEGKTFTVGTQTDEEVIQEMQEDIKKQQEAYFKKIASLFEQLKK